MLSSGKKLVIRNDTVFESVGGELFPLDADIYIRHWSKNLVGYKSENGPYKVIEKDGLLGIVESSSSEKGIMNVELFEEINSEYFPLLTEADEYYRQRPDGRYLGPVFRLLHGHGQPQMGSALPDTAVLLIGWRADG